MDDMIMQDLEICRAKIFSDISISDAEKEKISASIDKAMTCVTRCKKNYEESEASFPHNILPLILGLPEKVDGKWQDYDPNTPLTNDQLSGLQYIIGTLNEREQDVIILRYKYGHTLQEIGLKYGVTREMIRKIEAKALRKLRYPAKTIFVIKGYKATVEELNRKEQAAMEAAKKAVEKRESMIFADSNIIELGLSPRPYHCLDKAGIKTVADLLQYDEQKIRELRALGEKSFLEIKEKIAAYKLQACDF